MRRTVLIMLLASFALCGCSAAIASKQTGLVQKPDIEEKLPYVAGLYLSPEIQSATVTLETAEGTVATVAMGDYLRSALVRTAKRVFEGVIVLDEPVLVPARETADTAQEIWPDTPQERKSPDVLVTCYAAYMKGHTQGLPDCDDCDQNLSFRAEVVFDIRNVDGDLISRGRVSGHGLTSANSGSELPLTAGFRAAMAEAVESLAGHFAFALSSSSVEAPALASPADSLPEEERVAATKSDDAEM